MENVVMWNTNAIHPVISGVLCGVGNLDSISTWYSLVCPEVLGWEIYMAVDPLGLLWNEVCILCNPSQQKFT